MTSDVSNDHFAALRDYLHLDGRTAYYPVSVSNTQALASAYAALPGARQPLATRKLSRVQFANLNDVDKLTQVYRELDGANSCGTSPPSVPASWVSWLLAEYDRLAAAT